MEKIVRFGIIGAGAIAPSHIHAIHNTDGAVLSAICDIRPEAAAKLAEENGVPYFISVDEMLASGLVDAVSLCTPSGFHLETALAVISAGKHLLAEKPLEITTERIDTIIAASQGHDVVVGCSLQFRHVPFLQRLKKLIDAGLLGEIYSGSAYSKMFRSQEYYDSSGWRGTWRVDGGGCLMNQGIHLADLFIWMMGDVESVIALAGSKGRENVEVETLTQGLVTFKTGATGVIESSTLAYPGLPRYIEIFGSRGTISFSPEEIIRLDLVDPTPDEEAGVKELKEIMNAANSLRVSGKSSGVAIAQVDMGHGPVFQDFVDAIRYDRKPLVDATEARRCVEFIEAVYTSAKAGGAICRLSD